MASTIASCMAIFTVNCHTHAYILHYNELKDNMI